MLDTVICVASDGLVDVAVSVEAEVVDSGEVGAVVCMLAGAIFDGVTRVVAGSVVGDTTSNDGVVFGEEVGASLGDDAGVVVGDVDGLVGDVVARFVVGVASDNIVVL